MITQQLLERTAREWVRNNPARGARELRRLAAPIAIQAAQSADEVAEALIRLAGRMEIADTRVW